jgi:hypothetical protein
MTADVLVAGLQGVRATGSGRWRAICPAHPSKHGSRSLAVREEPDGRVLLHCFAGCNPFEVVGALGLELSDLFPPRVDDDKRPPRISRPFSAAEALACVAHEALYVAVVAGDLSRGDALSEPERQRLLIAVGRINTAVGITTS